MTSQVLQEACFAHDLVCMTEKARLCMYLVERDTFAEYIESFPDSDLNTNLFDGSPLSNIHFGSLANY
jgi:hypothetical protein